jgi:hypothetical protein
MAQPPTTQKELKSFLGLANYYRDFVQHYAHIAAPPQALDKQNVVFRWTPAAQHGFQKLKTALIMAPPLILPTPTGEFVLDVSTTELAISATLRQWQEGTLATLSHKSCSLKTSELLYKKPKRLMFAVYTSIQKYKSLLINRKFHLRCDNLALRYLKTYSTKDGMIQRWILKLKPFFFYQTQLDEQTAPASLFSLCTRQRKHKNKSRHERTKTREFPIAQILQRPRPRCPNPTTPTANTSLFAATEHSQPNARHSSACA